MSQLYKLLYAKQSVWPVVEPPQYALAPCKCKEICINIQQISTWYWCSILTSEQMFLFTQLIKIFQLRKMPFISLYDADVCTLQCMVRGYRRSVVLWLCNPQLSQCLKLLKWVDRPIAVHCLAVVLCLIYAIWSLFSVHFMRYVVAMAYYQRNFRRRW